MNIFDLNTKEKLETYGKEFLVVTEGISPSELTGFSRAVALLDVNISLRTKTINLVLGVYELDKDGNPIISKSLRPYEEVLVASNSNRVDITTPNFDIVLEEDMVEDVDYVGEFDAYVYLTKNNPVMLWDLFNAVIKRSSNFKI